MGVDYIARKAAKKRAKKERRDDHKGDHNARKERAARGVPKKRLGVCWGQPVLTEEDKFESEDEAGDASQHDVLCGAGLDEPQLRPEMLKSNREKRLKATVHFNKNNNFDLLRAAAIPKDADHPSATAKKVPAKKDKKSLKLSTAVAPLPSSKQVADTEDDPAPAAPESGSNALAPEGQTAAQTSALADLHPVMQAYLVQSGFTEPTEIQRRVWPLACSGRDVVAQAPTGSGKTLAFVLPMAVRLVEAGHGRDTRPAGPPGLAVEPTRELALQTARAFAPLKRAAGLRAACVYGGADRSEQIALLQHLPHVLVATPGRLLDLYDAGALRLSHVRCVALDECDKMLGLGFAPQLDRLAGLLLHAPPAAAESAGLSGADEPPAAAAADVPRKKRRRDAADRTELVPLADPAALALPADADAGGRPQRPQVLLLSATGAAEGEEGAHGSSGGEVPEAIRRWVATDAERVCVAGLTGASVSETITQVVQVCAEHKKLAKLLKHLQSVNSAQGGARQLPRVLIFANRIKTVAYLHKELLAAGFKAEALHGQRSQEEREAALRGFRAGKAQVLVATDVAARGLHVRALPYIVNYDFPGNLETYIHRVGRTGRLKAHGHAFSFFTRNLARIAPATVDLLTDCGQALDPNLVKLRDAFAVVVAKLGPERAAALMRDGSAAPAGCGGPTEADAGANGADADGDAEMGPGCVDYPDDLREGVEVLLQGKKANKKPKKAPSEGTGAEELPEQERPDFIPSRRFTGRRPGFIFSTRARGTGYYPDAATPAKRKRSAQRGQAREGGGHSARQPPRAKAVAAAAQAAAAEPPKQPQQRSKKSGILGPPKTALLAGDLGGSDGAPSSDEEPPSRRKVASGAGEAVGKISAKGKKALPGRLRKKLARDKAAA